MRHRHRRGPYALAETPGASTRRFLRPILGAVVLIALLYWGGSAILQQFGVGNSIRRTSVTLYTEGRGAVNVSLEGASMRRAENDIRLYQGDRIQSGPGAAASLQFFDESIARVNETTDVSIAESALGKKTSKLGLTLFEGSLWIATPTLESFSGSIVRQVETNRLVFSIPSHTEAVLTPSSIIVFAADGPGVDITVRGTDNGLVVGEGQQFLLASSANLEGDLYQYRTALDPQALRSEFVEDSRQVYALHTHEEDTSFRELQQPDSAILTVRTPEDGSTAETATVLVTGSVGEAVNIVRANGYELAIDEESRSFSQELSLPDEDEVTVVIEALDQEANVIAQESRTIKRNREPPLPPTITSPSGSGTTYRTASESIEISGGTPADAVGIIVNDYRLQLFSPGDTRWSYLASTKLGNYQPGENVYEVRAINRGGYQSAPATITIVLGEGEEGVISVPQEPDPEEGTFPENPALRPGTLQVLAPTEGLEHTETEELEILIEGTTARVTESIWVNDYRLQLYQAGNPNWNYIASVELRTMKRGANSYNIVARDSDGRILDEITYVINFLPGRNEE